MFVFDKRVNKYVRVPAITKPIGNGKNKGTARSMVRAMDIQKEFKSRLSFNAYHKWS